MRGMKPSTWTQATRDNVASLIAGALIALFIAAAAVFVLWAADTDAQEADSLAIEGVWSETSGGFDLMGGAYIIDRDAECVTIADLYETNDEGTILVAELGKAGWDQVTLPEGRYFFAVRGDCSWTIRIFRDVPSPT
jgi:hypothetical protein